jgi:hypothetical protein
MNVSDIEQALPVLERLGFLERLPFNGQRKQGETSGAKTGKKRSKKSEHKKGRKPKNAEKPTVEGHAEGLPESAGTGRTEPESLCPPSRKSKSKAKAKAKTTLTGLNGKEEEDRKTLTGFSKKKEQNTADQKRAEQTTATTDQKKQEPENPMNPKESEAGEAIKHIVPTPPRSAKRAGPQAIGQIINARFPEHWTDSDCEAFGWEIVRALGKPADQHNLEIRSEWGAFAAWWSRVKHAVPATMLSGLRSMAIGKAIWIHAGPRKPKNVRNESALWFDIMGKEMAHRGICLDLRQTEKCAPGGVK